MEPLKTTKITKIGYFPCFLDQNPYPQQGLMDKSTKCIPPPARRRHFGQNNRLFPAKNGGFRPEMGYFGVFPKPGFEAKHGLF